MITDEQLDEMARTLVPRLNDVARRWYEDENWQLYRPQLGSYHYWARRQLEMPMEGTRYQSDGETGNRSSLGINRTVSEVKATETDFSSESGGRNDE